MRDSGIVLLAVASLHAYRLAHKTYWSISREQIARHRRQKEALQALAMLLSYFEMI